MHVCITNHVSEVYVCMYNKPYMWGVCLYIRDKNTIYKSLLATNSSKEVAS
jgi:hypothetical protein